MNLDVIAEIVATSFNADRPVLHRYSATVVLRAPDKTATRRSTGYGETADSARSSAIRAALQFWGVRNNHRPGRSARIVTDPTG